VKNSSGQTALMLASRAGHVDVVRLLLDNGANVNARSEHTFNMTALEFAQIQRAAHQNSERANVYNEIIKLLEAAEKAQKEKAARK
jgi:ankyrin repeat protein